MLPYANYPPTCGAELSIRIPVPIDVPSQLLRPPLAIGDGHRLVFRALVPKTAVDEYGDTGAPKNEVRSTAESGQRRGIDEIPEPSTVQFST
jgi:hypothetical protein